MSSSSFRLRPAEAEALLEYASPLQVTYLKAFIQFGSVTAAARSLGIAHQTVSLAIQRARAAAAERGVAPDYGFTHATPAGFLVERASNYYNKDGELAGQWVKIKADEARQIEAARAFVAEVLEPTRGIATPIKAPKIALEDLASAYGAGDPHFGMHAWGKETGGADFDLEIAEDQFKGATARLIETAPASSEAIFIDVGDTTHADSRKAATPQSGHQLDVDSRYQKVIRVTSRTYRYVIDALLRKHQTVHVKIAPGNHSPDTAGWLSLCLSFIYEREPRVIIDLAPSYYLYYRFGSVLIGITHGDKAAAKFKDLGPIMATDRARDWGETKHRYWLTGHIHHEKKQEFPGIVVESLNTLAPADVWNSEQGYRSRRQMSRIDFHREHGEVSRGVCNVQMLT